MNKLIMLLMGIGTTFSGFVQKEGNPEENLPPYITRVTQFGQRADWSHDGKKISVYREDLWRCL